MRFSHLGSVSLVLDDQGEVLEQQRYRPFGLPRTTAPFAAVTSTDFTYTGQRDLPGTGLMDYKARFYSPTLGRFTQPDTIIPNAANPQSWNRYSYVQNNPIRYNDPDGHCGGPACAILIPISLVALVVIGVTYYSQPHVQAAGHDLLLRIERSVEDLRGRDPHKNNREALEAGSGQTTNNGLPVTFKLSNKCGIACKLALIPILAAVACVSMFGDNCRKAASPKIIDESIESNENSSNSVCGDAEFCYTAPPKSKSSCIHTIISGIPCFEANSESSTKNLSSNSNVEDTVKKPALPSMSTFEQRLIRKGLLE